MATPWQPPQAQALSSALEGSSIPSAAADHLASLTLTLDPEHIEDNLDALWHLLLTRAAQTSTPSKTHPILVDILVHLSKLDDAEDPSSLNKSAGGSGKGEALVVQDMHVWRDLPMFGWAVREYMNFSPVPRPGQTEEQRREKGREFVNVNAFVAQLMATEEAVFDFSWLAMGTLREALEEDGAEEDKPQRRERLGVYVPAAAAWIEHLGVAMHAWDERPGSHSAGAAAALEEEEENAAVGGSVAALGRAGKLWKGSHGFGKQRWEFWQERFTTLAKEESGLGEEARSAAAEAAALMKDISAGEIDE